ncbi:unnamed protein product [Lathyrus oleraceus]
MEKWKYIPLSKEEEEIVVAVDEEMCEEESFQRTLVGNIWMESSFNAKTFKITMLNAWKLKIPFETQDLSKSLFLFKFSTKRDLEFFSHERPLDRSMCVLN